jgi:hypothetical protein
MNSNHYSTSTLDTITWLCDEAFLLISPRPDGDSKIRVRHSVKSVIAPTPCIEHHGWQFIIILHESWFYLAADHEHIWLCPKEQPPERSGHMFQDPKIMVRIAWNPFEFHMLDALPSGRSCNADYRRENVLSALLRLCP